MEAIDAKMLAHNEDPSAHGVSGEAVHTHRAAALLDHVNGCGVKDENGVAIADTKGLVSTTQFVSDSVFADTTESTDSEVMVDMPDMTLSFNLARAAKILILFNGSIVEDVDAVSKHVVMSLVIDDVDMDDDIVIGGAVVANEQNFASAFLHSVQNLAAGDHTIKIQWNVWDTDYPFKVIDRRLTYLLLGK